MDLRPLTPANLPAAKALLASAFAADPTHRWLLQAERPGYAQRLNAYLHAYLTYHQSAGLPTLALFSGEDLLAAAWVTPAGYQPEPQAWQALGAEIAERCGGDVLPRLAQLFAFAEQAPHANDYSCLEFIAVSPAAQGQGLGQQLLKVVQQNTPNGLQLMTGNPRAAAFYQRQGFVSWASCKTAEVTQVGFLRG
ncbi:Acetyltransferase (GNAT) domain-containing protein [Atopomonas hussainii]|uniref:Acetyltransferase (GNAT) domain-containing protein n=1 Tax=Atopomonas hussainii TaxID=1429083 RepID=A0A1H7NZQ3_9GAMM|nr:GNAT family N-acetyltransferase [Atopomonas hussainii]SEL28528.1 Acetyltransferase (GNAT) domain-containing protein [Atopomonas hussainii]